MPTRSPTGSEVRTRCERGLPEVLDELDDDDMAETLSVVNCSTRLFGRPSGSVWLASRSVNLDGGAHRIPLAATGELWICGKHAIAPDRTGLISRIGATDRRAHVVCLVERFEIADRYPDYVRWLDSNQGSTWFPIHDLSSPDLAAVRDLYVDVWTRVRSGDVVIAHCAAGMGRAGTLAVGVCILAGMNLEESLEHVRRHRPGAGPEVGSQREVVEELARSVAGG